MKTFDLPDEALEFLRAGRQLDYDPSSVEPGEVRLKGLAELSLEEVWIHNDMDGDPNAGDDGFYSIPAVSLTEECKAYDPDFILLWLPRERLFGTWDCDHWELKVFRGASWSDIVATPARFLNSQWNPDDDVGSRFEPWLNYKLKPGSPF